MCLFSPTKEQPREQYPDHQILWCNKNIGPKEMPVEVLEGFHHLFPSPCHMKRRNPDAACQLERIDSFGKEGWPGQNNWRATRLNL